MWERIILDMLNGYMQTMVDVMTFILVKLDDLFKEFIKTSLVVFGLVLAFGAVAGGIWTLFIIRGILL